MWSKSLPLLFLLSTIVQSLLVVPSSPQCAALCGNTLSATTGSEMTCHDGEYSSAFGTTFKACIACELASPYYDTATKQADLRWAIYNLRYALSWCLFGYENNTKVANTPCLTSFSCAPLQSAVEFSSLNPNASTYSFCPLFTASQASVKSCTECLRETGSEFYLSNMVTVLDAACKQQPVQGNIISIEGSVFSPTRVNITSSSSTSATPIAPYVPKTSGLDLGAKIGIAVGGVVVILVALGFCIVTRGRKKRLAAITAHQRASGYATWQHNLRAAPPGSPYLGSAVSPREQHFFDSPQSQRPLNRTLSWNRGSPQSATTDKSFFSPYNSNYNSPVSARDGLGHVGGAWPVVDRSVGPAPPGPGIQMTKVILKSPWETLKQGSAPVLHHPGPGRLT